MSPEVSYIFKNGAIRKQMTTEIGVAPMSDFLDRLVEQAPKLTKTPPLPADCVMYTKVPNGSAFYEMFCVYTQPAIHTIAWRDRIGGDTLQTFTVSWPGTMFKFTFRSDGVMTAPEVAICGTRPTRLQEKLFVPSLPNVWENGQICMVPQSTPGNFAASCNDTVRSFFTGQAFNNDLCRWPAGCSGFQDWQDKTDSDPTWIEKVKWTYALTLGEWSSTVTSP